MAADRVTFYAFDAENSVGARADSGTEGKHSPETLSLERTGARPVHVATNGDTARREPCATPGRDIILDFRLAGGSESAAVERVRIVRKLLISRRRSIFQQSAIDNRLT
jgi:hypothetical protein